MVQIANEIVFDKAKGRILIDGLEFPFHVELDPSVEVDDDWGMAIFRIGVFAQNFRVIGMDGEQRSVVRAPLEDELAWARQRGREIVREGMADIIAQLRPAG